MNSILMNELSYSASSNMFFEPDFQQTLDSHVQLLKTQGKVSVVEVDDRYKGQYTGDFYAILNTMRVNPKYHRIVGLMNGITNPIYYNNELDHILLPDESVIDGVLMVYNTGRRFLNLDKPSD